MVVESRPADFAERSCIRGNDIVTNVRAAGVISA